MAQRAQSWEGSEMNKAIVIHEHGGPEVLKFEDYPVGDPGPGEVCVRQEAIGLNFIDVYHRTGLYPAKLPFVPGREGAGTIMAVGAGVSDFKPGDRVCAYDPLGAYSGIRKLPANRLLPIPDGVSFETAAAITLKGMTVCYLMDMTWQVKPGDTILLHAAAGGVGQMAVQWAKAAGARVIGTVGSDEKAAIVRELGCDEVINTRSEDFVARTRDLTGGRGVDVVYDSVGKDTFERSLDCLRPRGLMVSFGNASGPVSVPSLGILASKGSLYLTRTTLAHYYSDRDVELQSARKLFDKVRTGALKISIGQSFALKDAADAHRALEGRKTTGSTILVP